MIIKYPTGLYDSILPRSPSDSGNVTFTISSSEPPRTSLLFPKLPPGVLNKRRPQKTIDMATRRNSMSTLLFTSNKVNRSATATAIRQYEVGQLLDFGDSTDLRTLEPNTAGESSEIRHDTGLLDYQRLGLSDTQQALIEVEADAVYQRKQKELSDSRQLYSDTQVQIQENQKMSVETGRALVALKAMGSLDPAIIKMIDDLTTKQSDLNSERGRLINRANDTAKASAAVLESLRGLAQLVR